MFTIKCVCGKSEKNFKFNIGPFFVNDCCKEAGFDDLGNRKEPALSQEEIDALAKDLSQAEDLVIKDEPKLDEPTEAEKQEDKPEEPKEEVKPAVVKPVKPLKPAKPAKPQG